MILKSMKSILAGAALATAALTSSGADLISNGSFEAGAFVSNHGLDNTMSLPAGSITMPFWTVTKDIIAWIDTPNPFGLTASPGHGIKFLDLTDYVSGPPFGGVEQTIATTTGVFYKLTFDLGSSLTFGVPDIIKATAGATTALFGSTLLGTNNWEPEAVIFIGSPGPTTTISLVGNTGLYYIGLDNVAVVALSAIPEAETYAMMLAGLGLMGFVVHRRRGAKPAA